MQSRLKLVFFVAAGTWLVAALLYCALREPFGFNYHIYKHFAVLANQGVDIFHHEGTIPGDSPQITGKYLDFTPAALALYRALFLISPAVYGYYQTLLAIAILWIAYRLYTLRYLDTFQFNCFFIAAVASPVWMLVPILEGEDKFIFALCPLLLAFLRWRRPGLSYIYLLGFFVGLCGFPVLFLPLAMIDTLRSWRHKPQLATLAPLAACLAVCLCLSLLYYPDSTVMFANRATRALREPFWHSLWRLFPGLYGHYTRVLAVVVFCSFAYVRYYQGRLSGLEAMTFIAFAFLITDNYIGFDRVNTVVVLPIIASQSRAFLRIYTPVAVAVLHLMVLFAYLHVFNNRVDEWFVPDMLIVNGCLVGYLGYLICKPYTRVAIPPLAGRVSA